MNDRSRPKKHRHSRNYSLILASGDSDGKSRTWHLNFAAAQVLAFLIFALILATICYIIYSSMTISSLREAMSIQAAQIDTLTKERDDALAEGDRLQDEVTQLSLAITQKMANEADLAAAEEELREPTGVPLSGTASIADSFDDPDSTVMPGTEEATSGNPIVVFKSENGSLVIASGLGTVSLVGADSKFGNIVQIDHGNGYVSIYRNAGTPLVREGDEVHRGDIMFVVDDESQTLGYQITSDDVYIDPETMIKING